MEEYYAVPGCGGCGVGGEVDAGEGGGAEGCEFGEELAFSEGLGV